MNGSDSAECKPNMVTDQKWGQKGGGGKGNRCLRLLVVAVLFLKTELKQVNNKSHISLLLKIKEANNIK